MAHRMARRPTARQHELVEKAKAEVARAKSEQEEHLHDETLEHG